MESGKQARKEGSKVSEEGGVKRKKEGRGWRDEDVCWI